MQTLCCWFDYSAFLLWTKFRAVGSRLNVVKYAEIARHYFLKNKMESKVSDAEENIKRLKRKYGMKTAS